MSSNYYKNLKLHSVKYGFGWRYDGDMSTHPIGNVLENLDYRFEKLTNNNIKLLNENNKLKNALDKAIGYVESYAKSNIEVDDAKSKIEKELE